jgi:tetratricopeptide (TPR) repeat protein
MKIGERKTMMLRSRILSIAILITAGSAFQAAAQISGVDLNEYYRFPLSLGVQYKSMTPLAGYKADYDLFDLSAAFRLPLAALPVLQPSVEGGILQFDARNAADSRWSHRDIYALLGATYSSRLGKSFEIGGELSAGASYSNYSKFMPASGESYSQVNLLAEVGGKLQLIPSFNFSIELSPSLRYLSALGPLSDFDGFIFGFGISGHIRLGEDPDAPKAALRSLQLGLSKMPPIFPAMQNWYSKNPLAVLSIENKERFPLENVEVTFFQKGFMDSPTLCAKLPLLAAGAGAEIGILASFNQEVFRNEGVTPLSGEVVVTYRGRGRAGEQKTSVSYDLLDKSAITWDDDRKEAAFITPADSALRNYASYIRQTSKDRGVEGYDESAQFACQLFYALTELGILYQVDPNTPFESVKGGSLSIDSVSLPRDTMRRITGDCDDLTALYSSILESAGIASAFITVPGHIYAAFKAKTAPNAFAELNADRAMTIAVGDGLWVPVEITMIGQATFIEAWRKGAEEWNSLAANPAERHFYETSKAQELYKPVGLKEADLGLQYGRKEPIVENSARDLGKLVDGIVDQAQDLARQSGLKEDWNRLGIKLARYGRFDKAIAAFKTASSLDTRYTSPKINLGNVYFLSKSYDKALGEFRAIENSKSQEIENRSLALLRVNISKCYRALGNGSKSSEYLALATSLDPSLATRYAYLADAGGTERAAAAVDESRDIAFSE